VLFIKNRGNPSQIFFVSKFPNLSEAIKQQWQGNNKQEAEAASKEEEVVGPAVEVEEGFKEEALEQPLPRQHNIK
jgi:hypothetical protein